MVYYIKQNLAYFIVTTLAIAIFGMLVSKMSTDKFSIMSNIIGSIVGGLIFVYLKTRQKT